MEDTERRSRVILIHACRGFLKTEALNETAMSWRPAHLMALLLANSDNAAAP